MKTYCVKCTKNTESLNTKNFKTKNDRLIMQSKCTESDLKSQDLWKNNKQKDY